MFIHAMYGNSLKETLCPLPRAYSTYADDPVTDIRNVRNIISFGHMYNIGQIESAVCDIITSHRNEFGDAAPLNIVDLYNNVPVVSGALQDALFQVLQSMAEEFDFDILGSHIVVAPRHVNEKLNRLREAPDEKLHLLHSVVEKEVISGNLHSSAETLALTRNHTLLQELIGDFGVVVPIPDLESIYFSAEDMKKWREFAGDLQPGEFKQSIVKWCQDVQCLMYKRERNCYKHEHDCYKRYIHSSPKQAHQDQRSPSFA